MIEDIPHVGGIYTLKLELSSGRFVTILLEINMSLSDYDLLWLMTHITHVITWVCRNRANSCFFHMYCACIPKINNMKHSCNDFLRLMIK